MIPDTKTCRRCGGDKPLTEFPRSSSSKDGHTCYCAPCNSIKGAEWRARNPERSRRLSGEWHRRYPERHRNALLKRNYGITSEQYDEMLAAQGGVCAICHKKCGSGRRLAVDHDHASGKIRGLLCGHCNMAVGQLGDDPERLRAAADYLDQFDSRVAVR